MTQLPIRTATLRLLAAAVLAISTATASAAEIDYNRDVRPLLSDRCFFCHGPDPKHRQADLRLDVEDEAKALAVVEGDPESSELFLRITSEDADLRMPPPDSGKQLSADEIGLLRRWIEQGAPYEPFWAYTIPRRHPAPAVKNAAWPAHWIDNFILARLEQEGLEPSPEADRVTLLRRVYFDLIGLPPTADEVNAFLADDDADAYEKVVDRLLASDRYGERMAIYWLDLVRFADTVGYHGDQDHNISLYRDWVIDALNDNLPFDQFTREQLAGDLLPDATIDQRIATGYNRMLQTSHEGGVQPKEYLAIYAADRVRNVSTVWLGATMGCAQCHDHKYDPYTMHDFYAMEAFFADIDEAQHFKTGSNALPTARPPEIEALSRRDRRRAAELQSEIARLVTEQSDNAQPGTESDGSSREQRLAELRSELEQVQARKRKTMVTVSIEPRTIRVLPRGNWLDDSGPAVQPAVPEFLGAIETEGRATRLDLANWLTDVEQGVGGLTARVFANRFWYLLMGVGIAKSLDDFGGQGEPPVHPQLLDNLAVEFHESGWDVKHLLKQIVMSRTYRQSSLETPEQRQRDPYNRLYARQSRFRLPAEVIRDNALAISGLLRLDYGGASVKPYQPAGYYRHLNFPQRKYVHHADERQWRRGVYVHWQRQFLHPMLRAFDAPSREECTAERSRSNTPLAALTLLNDPTFVEAARAFAARILHEGGETDEARLDFAFRTTLGRAPDDFESDVLNDLLRENFDEYRTDTSAATKLLATGDAPTPDDLDPADLAAWTAVARALLNLNETITRN